jgi:hypothetical protein
MGSGTISIQAGGGYDRGREEIRRQGRIRWQLQQLPRRSSPVITNRFCFTVCLEADECYWVSNELAVRGRTDFDFDIDPPTDIAVEVEISTSVLNRLGIYAALRVSEVWRSDGHKVLVEQLQDDGTYAQVSQSPSFPRLPLAALGRFLEASKTMDETSWIRSFRAWVRAELAPLVSEFGDRQG